MGVLGLTTFVARDADKYLNSTVLKDCNLVIDGNCIASHLFKWRTKRDSAFGGDYDEYFDVVKYFFGQLKKCRITPIVVMDGGYEKRKLPTIFQRIKDKVQVLKITLSSGFCDVKFFPLFMLQVFCEAVEKSKVQLIQSEFEADGEIAALARKLNCPVLSNDSDFYLFDVYYVPFSTMDLEPTEEDGTYGFQCKMYDVENFLKLFPGLNKRHLPIIAVLLGNDFNDLTLYNNFFLHGPVCKMNKSDDKDTRIIGLLTWLSTVSDEAAIQKVKEYIDEENFEKFEIMLINARANYSFPGNCDVKIMPDGKFKVHSPQFKTSFHPMIQSLLASSKLPPFIITLTALRQYVPPLEVESVKSESCHLTSLMLVDAIDRLLCSYTEDTSPLRVYVRKGSWLKEYYGKRNDIGNDQYYESLIHEPMDIRRDFIMNVLSFDGDEKDCVYKFIPECQLFICAFINWCIQEGIPAYQVNATIMCYIACQAKYKVGYFRVGKDSKLPVEQVSAFVGLFSAYRKTTNAAKVSYSTEIVHEFSRFQSLLYYISALNTMLGCPFIPCRVMESFNGTVACNMFAYDNRKHLYKSVQEFLKTAPEISEIYTNITGYLFHYVPLMTVRNGDKKKKKKKKAKDFKKTDDDEEKRGKGSKNTEDDLDDGDYNDLSNKFNCLRAGDSM